MNKKFFIVGLMCGTALVANMGPQGFGHYMNRYFVETGTFGGGGVDKALKAGFKEIRSIEFDINHVKYATARFIHNKNVRLYHGSSATGLWDMIKDIQEPITFWLDAHIYPPCVGAKNCPLIQELEQIKMHPIKTHTILIDDMHCAGTDAFDYLTKEDLMKKLLEINPNYKIFYVPGGDEGEYPQNVMVAMIN